MMVTFLHYSVHEKSMLLVSAYIYIYTLHTCMQVNLMLTFSVNVYPGIQNLTGTVDEGLAMVPAWELLLERVDLKDTTPHQHPVLQTQTRTLVLGWIWNFLQGLVVVAPAHWQFVVRNYWTTFLKTQAAWMYIFDILNGCWKCLKGNYTDFTNHSQFPGAVEYYCIFDKSCI